LSEAAIIRAIELEQKCRQSANGVSPEVSRLPYVTMCFIFVICSYFLHFIFSDEYLLEAEVALWQKGACALLPLKEVVDSCKVVAKVSSLSSPMNPFTLTF
jgi:hypothetical protein